MRELNKVTIADAYPVPSISDNIDQLAGSKYFSTVDMTKSYWQVPLDEKGQEAATFVTRSGQYSYTCLAMGLLNSAASLQRVLGDVMSGLQWKSVLIYLDDVIVFSTTIEQHIERLREVLERYRKANLKLNPKKCELLKREIKYLGFRVSGEGIAPDSFKTKAVSEWPVPRCLTDTKSFLGVTGYYRKHIADYAMVAKPLTMLTTKGTRFQWGPEQQEAFDKLKERLVSAPVLAYPDPEAELVLDTDASGVSISGVLGQVRDGEERVIAYWSRTLSTCERQYCTTRRELLAVVEATRHLLPYLLGRQFRLRTDHASLLWLRRRKQPSAQVAQWLEQLADFNYTMEHRCGERHQNADGLSRQQCSNCEKCNRIVARDGGPTRAEIVEESNRMAGQYVVSELAGVLKCKLVYDNAKFPVRAMIDDAGVDLHSVEEVIIPAKQRRLVATGIIVELPSGTYGRISPRSGLSWRHGIDIAAGIVDSSYRGVVKVLLVNNSEQAFSVQCGDRVAQLICEKIVLPRVVEVQEMSETRRGARGFGSTDGLETSNGKQPAISEIYTNVSGPNEMKELAEAQQCGPSDLADMYEHVKTQYPVSSEDLELRGKEFSQLFMLWERLSIDGKGVLRVDMDVGKRRQKLAVCPYQWRRDVIWNTHRMAHTGMNQTFWRLRQQWYWPGMNADVRRQVKTCGI